MPLPRRVLRAADGKLRLACRAVARLAPPKPPPSAADAQAMTAAELRAPWPVAPHAVLPHFLGWPDRACVPARAVTLQDAADSLRRAYPDQAELDGLVRSARRLLPGELQGCGTLRLDACCGRQLQLDESLRLPPSASALNLLAGLAARAEEPAADALARRPRSPAREHACTRPCHGATPCASPQMPPG